MIAFICTRFLKRETNVAKDAVGHAPQYLSPTMPAKPRSRLVTPLLRRDMNPVLVAHGANANHLDAQCGTALQMAIAQRNTAVADALRQTGATE
ncbi:ankyrin repeat protein [Paraburkholderia sp. UCT70]|uniref:hypothetical protein n=1 Tax=Paraburkholderia sp. UCT70 TaxID=2991068 RepID=UPI003D1CE602